MGGGRAARFEAAVDRLAAAVFGAAVAFASVKLLKGNVTPTTLAALAGAAGAVAYAFCLRVLRWIGPAEPEFALHAFQVAPLDCPAAVELVLTDADRLQVVAEAADELVLDDILAEIGPDSRVIRLFDPAAMPTPGQLKSRIDEHLHGESIGLSAPDDSRALYDALAELRRSLR